MVHYSTRRFLFHIHIPQCTPSPPRLPPPPKVRDLEKELEMASINWKRHKRDLDDTFFADGSTLIQRNSAEYQNFWGFLDKFQLVQRKKLVAEMASNSGSGSGDGRDASDKSHHSKASDLPKALRDLPAKFDKRYKVNFSLLTEDLKRAKEVRYDWRGQIVDSDQGGTR